MVDHLTKMVHFIPCTKIITDKGIAKLFLDHFFQYRGLFEDIIFYCGLQFASKFWKQLFELLGVKVKLSSTFHPWTYGQIEWVNQIFEQYLQWSEFLAMANFPYNNTVHSSTQQTPFFSDHGLHPKFNIQGVTKLWIQQLRIKPHG